MFDRELSNTPREDQVATLVASSTFREKKFPEKSVDNCTEQQNGGRSNFETILLTIIVTVSR